jgi:NADPH:quinone reductase-like Zn-dependent oxidoreductase
MRRRALVKAAVIYENGDLDKIRLADVPNPEPGEDEVVIEVRAASLNHLDIWVRKGRPGLELSMPHVLGSDAAGVVVDIGRSVMTVEVGDEVVVNPGLSCGWCEYCLRGQQSECLNFGIVGMSCPGTFAELVAVPAKNVHRRPAHLSWEESAAFPLAYVTAWRMLMSRARLQVGETVLIHGIGGGVALAALQIAKTANARVCVTSSSNDKLLRAKEFGADHTINYETVDDVAAAVRDWTDGRGVDVIVDSVGAATFPVNLNAARRGGRIVHCGVTTGAQAQINLSALYWNHLNVMGSTMGSNEDFRQLVEAIDAARLKPIIDSVEPLERIRYATERMERGEQFGKIVVTPHILTGSEPERALEERRPYEQQQVVPLAETALAETAGDTEEGAESV